MERSTIEKTVKQTRFALNPYFAEGGIHPEFMPVQYAPCESPEEAVDLFKENILSIHESDDGDFMRAANSQIVRLGERIGSMSRSIARRLGVMQTYTQFSPDRKIENTKERLVHDANVLKNWIAKFHAGLTRDAKIFCFPNQERDRFSERRVS